MLSIPLLILGGLFIVAGVVFSVLPPVPGPPLAYLALICLSVARDWEPLGPLFLIVAAAVVLAVTILDYVVPAAGAKRYGAGKLAIWGSLVGMVVGTFFFPPLGTFVGAWAGALVGELIVGKSPPAALRASWGVFVGTMAGIALKIATCIAIGAVFVMNL